VFVQTLRLMYVNARSTELLGLPGRAVSGHLWMTPCHLWSPSRCPGLAPAPSPAWPLASRSHWITWRGCASPL